MLSGAGDRADARHTFHCYVATQLDRHGEPPSLGARASRNSSRVSVGSFLTLSAFQRRAGLYHTANSISTMSPTPMPSSETPLAGGNGISIVPIPTIFPLASA